MTEALTTHGPRGDAARLEIALATDADREAIYRMRHATYAAELGQHAVNERGRLTDALDAFNTYVVATLTGALVGFISITPPGHDRYSIDKYVARDELPFAFDDGLFEIRILTVDPAHRGGPAAGLLMYAALRWVETHGATRIVIIGRSEVAGLYERVGMRRVGRTIRSGAVSFEVMTATLAEIRAGLPSFAAVLRRLSPRVRWSLPIPFERSPDP
jgi:GNAT superfamily N-acetyltransferase